MISAAEQQAALEARRLLLMEYAKDGFETKEDLRRFVFCLLGFELPAKSVCDDHDSPMAFVEHDYFGDGGVTLVEACRDGFKTFALAVANIAQIFGHRASILHLGAVAEQAKNGYKYLKNLLVLSGLDRLAEKPTSKAWTFHNGAEIGIAGCTLNQTNSPRVPKVRIDEGDLADPKALAESKGVCSSDMHGNRSSWTMVSTRKFANGNVHSEQEKIENSGRGRFLRWCYKEVTERCPDSRSGTEPVDIFVDLMDLEWLTEEEYLKQAEQEYGATLISSSGLDNAHYQRFQVFEGCLDCPIVATCRGDLKRAGGVRPIQDLIDNYPGWDRSDWIAQKECRGAAQEGRIYRAFSRDRNVPLDDFPVWRSKKSGRTLGYMIWGKDWGYEHPDVTLVGQVVVGHCGHQHLWIHEELYVQHKDDEDVIKIMEDRGWFKRDKLGNIKEWDPDDEVLFGRPRVMAADVTSPKARKVYRKAGLLVPRNRTLVPDGQREVRKLIHPISCRSTHLHIHQRCKRVIKDMERYQNKLDKAGEPTETPDKGGESAPDHGADTIRFMVMYAFGRNRDWIKALPQPETKDESKK